jgi:hypothetical protein
MARRRGRSPKGERLRSGVPHGHRKTTTFVAGLRLTGIAAPFVLDGPIDRNAFETYIAKVLVPELAAGDVVVMDSLSSHKGPRVREMIEEAGATAPLPAALQPLPQSHRDGLLQAEGPPAQGSRG